MEVLEKHKNWSIVLGDDGLAKYLLEPYPFTDTEKKLLANSEKLFTQVELEAVRREPDIAIRKSALHEYLKMKVPETKNREAMIESIVNNVMGYGKLGDLMSDPELEEVMVNGTNVPVFIFHKKYGMCSTNVVFEDKDEIFRIVNKLCWIHGKEVAPIIDMSAIDGSRINITTDPIAIHGPTMTIRKQKKHLMTLTEMLQQGTLDIDVAALLWLSVDGMRISPANIIIAGMIGSGKTTLLNALTMMTPPDDRIVTIEDTSELQLSGKGNWVPMVVQKGYDMETLVRNSLRMRPNRIIVGEIRGAEAMALFNSMNVGHKGMGTMHSNSSREVLLRLETPPMNVPAMIAANLDLIVIMSTFKYHGHPIKRITEVAEIGGREGDTILLGKIYEWDPKSDKAVESDEMAPSAYLDKLASKLKVNKRSLIAELEKRKNLLINMVNNNIFEYDDVLATVNEFYRQESEVVEENEVSKELGEST